MPRSAASRDKDRGRARAWRKKNPQRANANNRKAGARWRSRHRDAHAEQRFRFRSTERQRFAGIAASGLSVITKESLQRPELLYLDANGRIHRERELSAEELIDQWKRSQPCPTK